MPNRLQPLNYFDFTGGVNLRPETFQLAENELPELLNMEVDPRGGINTRKGWAYSETAPVTTDPWDPRNAYVLRQANDNHLTLLMNGPVGATGAVWGQLNHDAYAKLFTDCTAAPHGADFASWDDDVWIVRGVGTQPTVTWNGTAVTNKTISGAATWQNDYTNPGANKCAPRAELIAQHQGYLFVASTYEDDIRHPTRIRWSHPNNPNAWALTDYIDISEGGQRITAIIPFSDRLLIFKPDSVWALFGYDADTWEITNISRTIGCHSQQLCARSENAAFFMSWPHGVFAYTEKANVEELSVPIRTVFQDHRMLASAINNSWMGWVGRRLWVSLPYLDEPPAPPDACTAFVWDPALGSWTMFRGAEMHACVPGPYVELTAYDENEPLISFIRQYPYPVVLDDTRTGAFDECVPGEAHGFSTRFRTRWLDAGAPTWKKSWRRPDLLLRGLEVTTTVNVQVFHDYDYGNAERSFIVGYTPDSFPDSWGSFVYGDGTTYGASAQTTSVERGGTMGRAGAVQLLAVGNPGDSWGVNGIIFKYIPRRFR